MSKQSSAPSSDSLEVPLRPREPLAAQPVEVDPLLPVDSHRPVCADGHRPYLFPTSDRARLDDAVRRRHRLVLEHGENGIGTSIAPMRRTGASRCQNAPSATTAASSAEAP